MTVSPKGVVIDHEITETVIHVDRRMSYTSVNKILTDRGRGRVQEIRRNWSRCLRQMETLSGILRAHRKQRGAIDFDFPEAKDNSG